ncbi:MAG: hypothetical protein JKY37_06645 [Nannocystaceae bacterium]|nr:hypothetical protein [Nannocystaceae bacterium]
MASASLRICLLGALVVAGPACANRRFLGGTDLLDVQRRDPTFAKLRVYPSSDFIAVYGRQLANDLSVSGQTGRVDEEYRAQRIEIPVRRSRPGVIVAVDAEDSSALLWVSFESRCASADCAFGFLQGDDGRFRLSQVPVFDGYSSGTVYRKRIAPRKVMEKTTLYSKTSSTSVYFTTRGAVLPVALEIKKRKTVRVETIVAPQQGVRPGQTPSAE